jgi:hypothetical protein
MHILWFGSYSLRYVVKMWYICLLKHLYWNVHAALLMTELETSRWSPVVENKSWTIHTIESYTAIQPREDTETIFFIPNKTNISFTKQGLVKEALKIVGEAVEYMLNKKSQFCLGKSWPWKGREREQLATFPCRPGPPLRPLGSVLWLRECLLGCDSFPLVFLSGCPISWATELRLPQSSRLLPASAWAFGFNHCLLGQSWVRVWKMTLIGCTFEAIAGQAPYQSLAPNETDCYTLLVGAQTTALREASSFSSPPTLLLLAWLFLLNQRDAYVSQVSSLSLLPT